MGLPAIPSSWIVVCIHLCMMLLLWLVVFIVVGFVVVLVGLVEVWLAGVREEWWW